VRIVVNASKESFMRATLFNHTVLFSPQKIDRSTVPEGYYVYGIRHDDDCRGEACQIRRFVFVNHWGDIITNRRLPLDSYGDLYIDDSDLLYANDHNTSLYLSEYIRLFPAF